MMLCNFCLLGLCHILHAQAYGCTQQVHVNCAIVGANLSLTKHVACAARRKSCICYNRWVCNYLSKAVPVFISKRMQTEDFTHIKKSFFCCLEALLSIPIEVSKFEKNNQQTTNPKTTTNLP